MTEDVSLRDCWEENIMETSYGRQRCGKEIYLLKNDIVILVKLKTKLLYY